MNANDVMTMPVISIAATDSVETAIRLMLEHHVSAVPVIDEKEQLAGIISEGDIIRRLRDGDEKHHAWWLEMLTELSPNMDEFIKAKSHHVSDVMTRDVVAVSDNTSVSEIARLLETNRIKRVPVIRDGRVVGIVSRANLLHALSALQKHNIPTPSSDDRDLREKISAALQDVPGIPLNLINYSVHQGHVSIAGAVHSAEEEHAIQVAIENVEGVVSIDAGLKTLPTWAFGYPV